MDNQIFPFRVLEHNLVQEEPPAVLNMSPRDLVGELRRRAVVLTLLDFAVEQVVESAVAVAVAVALVYKKGEEELKLVN
jgi:hypothetical protein